MYNSSEQRNINQKEKLIIAVPKLKSEFIPKFKLLKLNIWSWLMINIFAVSGGETDNNKETLGKTWISTC